MDDGIALVKTKEEAKQMLEKIKKFLKNKLPAIYILTDLLLSLLITLGIVKSLDLTVVAAVHDLNIAAMYCDRLVAIKEGQIVGMGTPRELLTEKFIYDMYEVRCRVDEEKSTGRINIVYLPQHWM